MDAVTRSTVIIPTLNTGTEMAQAAYEHAKADLDAADLALLYWDKERDGFAKTCNRAAAAPKADVLVFLNDDTLAQPGWLRPLVRAAVSHGIAGARLVYPDGRLQHSGVFLRPGEAYNRTTEAESGFVPAVTGACMAVTREAWDQLGGFDEDYVNGYEDVDLCLRWRLRGGDVWYCADSTVVHLESQSEGRFDHVRENVALLQERWGDVLEAV
jgi:GT2 family glycosyltransferase